MSFAKNSRFSIFLLQIHKVVSASIMTHFNLIQLYVTLSMNTEVNTYKGRYSRSVGLSSGVFV